MNKAYREFTNWDISDEEFFLLCPDAAVRGPEAAIDAARSLGRVHWEEIEAVALRDERFELPDEFAEFTDSLRDSDGEPDFGQLYRIAAEWDAGAECDICGAPIVLVDEFVNAALEHYGLDEDEDGSLGGWLVDCGVETGDFDNQQLCSYHGYVMSKDD